MREETDWKNVHVYGRTVVQEGCLNLVWTGSGVEFDIKGTEFGVVLEGGSSVYMPWISLVLDGTEVGHFPVQEGENRYMLIRAMEPTVTHRVRLLKDFQASPEDDESFVRLKKIIYDGEISKPEERKYRLEFIGDSITSGEGTRGAHDNMDWITPLFGTVDDYAVLTADKMNADFRIVSISGWGLVKGWDNNVHNNLPLVYDSINAKRKEQDYDHSSWPCDAVIINLCTNDEGAFSNPEFTDPETGKVYKNRKNPDGSFYQEELDEISAAIKKFLRHLREVNKKAHLLWVFGMLGFGLSDTIENAVNEYKKENNDDNAGYLRLKNTEGDMYGSRLHTGPIGHRIAADTICGYLKKILD
mgnify:CR=1 FL=1